MKTKTQIKVMAVAVASAFGAPLYAADEAVFSGEVTPKLFSFDYSKGSGNDATQFLERYNYQKDIGDGDHRKGNYLDLDLSIVGNNGKRNVFELEREGFGGYNHRGTVKANSDTLGLAGYYTNFRTSTGGLAFRYTPGQVPGYPEPNLPLQALYNNTNTGYVAVFNNDAPGQTSFKVDRTTYGMGLALKPTLFGNSLAAAVNYDGYQREGNRLANWVAGGSDLGIAGVAGTRERWRGFNMPVDEKLNRYTISLNGSPGGFNIGYEGTVEKFDNKARNFTMGSFAAIIPAPAIGANAIKPIHFVPDSTLISNNVRFSKNYGSLAVAAGYGLSVLDQDSFTTQQQSVGYNTGKITTNSAYLNVTSNAISGVGLEGYVRYNNRDNDSDFPVSGLISATEDQRLGVFVKSIETLNYGLAGTFRLSQLKSTVTVGWKHEDKDRDLTWSRAGFAPAPVLNAIMPQQSFYQEDTESDEFYVNWIARPMPGMILRVTPSYIWADETGQVTEPEKAFGVKTKLTYAANDGMLTSGYYNYRNRENSNNSIMGNLANAFPAGAATTQDLDRTEQAAGVSLSLPIGEWIKTNAGLSWLQDDFSSYYLRSGRRRFESPATALAFIVNDRPNYKIDTYVFTLGGDWQASDELRWNGSYSYTKSKGDTADGDIFTALSAANSIDGTIDSALHSLNLGVDYELKKNVKLKASYVYEYNKDESYSALTGAYHGLMLGVGFGF
jgi:hypothetical protein